MSDPKGLSRYGVIDLLRVGPVRLTKRSVRAPYRIKIASEWHETEFGYRFGEEIFDPASAVDRNLATMMVLQPALNYGLFCREIELVGPLDEADRSFVLAMMENTSREILVNKLHAANPFLLPGWQLTEIPELERYTQAEVRFTSGPETLGTESWPVREEGYCVLSSGGKESLLSYGILAELGCDTHPIYINESGRHWFTALNAHRYFFQYIPNTARVWTDSDRLFNWMLRHIPFIRRDFQRMRADDYPLRLWTVAVFLFAALPLIRKRGLSHLVVGNEFDTSRYLDQGPLPHYDGLYDQSVWFDRALSEYFKNKGWRVRVLSILRPLSETLVETVLAKRYPHLFATQVSCHAAISGMGRVNPCGRCEKCRRIMAILNAIGVDPGLIGYTEAMQRQALETLNEKGLHSQLASEFSQVLALLKEREVVQEIQYLRLGEPNAPLEEIPEAIQQALLDLLSKYSAGTVKRDGSDRRA